jgi:hypothetical protein
VQAGPSASSSVKVSMAATGDWVPDVTREAMCRLLGHAEKVGLPNTDECTLRAFFMAAAHDLLGKPGPQFQTEWYRFDLLVQIGALATVIEFKYYMQRPHPWTQGRTSELQGRSRTKERGRVQRLRQEAAHRCTKRCGRPALDSGLRTRGQRPVPPQLRPKLWRPRRRR